MDLEFPVLSRLPCEVCKKYQTDGKTGVIKRNKLTGEPYKRADPEMTACRTPLGCPKGTPESDISLTDRSRAAYAFHMRCKAVGRFPEDGIVETNAAIIEGVLRDYANYQQARMMANMFGAGRGHA